MPPTFSLTQSLWGNPSEDGAEVVLRRMKLGTSCSLTGMGTLRDEGEDGVESSIVTLPLTWTSLDDAVDVSVGVLLW